MVQREKCQQNAIRLRLLDQGIGIGGLLGIVAVFINANAPLLLLKKSNKSIKRLHRIHSIPILYNNKCILAYFSSILMYYIYIYIYIYYGARARAGGTCLVAVLHAASVIGCWGRAAGAASVIVCW